MHHDGFYVELDNIRTLALQNEPSLSPYDLDFDFLLDKNGIEGLCPYDFLHGCCDVFAQYLHDTYGYAIEAVYEGKQLIHAYCVATCNDKPVFIDIRGETDDYDELLSEFDLTEDDIWLSDGDLRISKMLPNPILKTDAIYHACRWMDDYYHFWN